MGSTARILTLLILAQQLANKAERGQTGHSRVDFRVLSFHNCSSESCRSKNSNSMNRQSNSTRVCELICYGERLRISAQNAGAGQGNSEWDGGLLGDPESLHPEQVMIEDLCSSRRVPRFDRFSGASLLNSVLLMDSWRVITNRPVKTRLKLFFRGKTRQEQPRLGGVGFLLINGISNRIGVRTFS